jgi:hypothetical protein
VTADDQKLLERLQRAYQCCETCGMQYGLYKAGCSSWWRSVCDVCGLENAVTETRDWSYLTRGINALQRSGRP